MRSLKKYSLQTILVIFSLINSAVWAEDNAATPSVQTAVTKTATPSKTPAVKPVSVKKDFKWFFKYGCSCAQCRAFQQQQADEQERLKNNFQP